MRSWGFTFILFAVLSAILPKFGLQLFFVMWIDNWGPTVGWIIRGGMAALGLGLIVADRSARGGGQARGG